jgi:anti-sigma regulatory factor (Ser/Thr protein kinase)
LPARPSSLRLVRDAIRGLASRLRLDEDRLFALNVAVGEAVSNAVEHAYGAEPGTVYLRLRRDGTTLRVEIADHGRWRPDRPGGAGGRGLAVMRGLVENLEVTTGPRGTTVRFAIPLAP